MQQFNKKQAFYIIFILLILFALSFVKALDVQSKMFPVFNYPINVSEPNFYEIDLKNLYSGFYSIGLNPTLRDYFSSNSENFYTKGICKYMKESICDNAFDGEIKLILYEKTQGSQKGVTLNENQSVSGDKLMDFKFSKGQNYLLKLSVEKSDKNFVNNSQFLSVILIRQMGVYFDLLLFKYIIPIIIALLIIVLLTIYFYRKYIINKLGKLKKGKR